MQLLLMGSLALFQFNDQLFNLGCGDKRSHTVLTHGLPGPLPALFLWLLPDLDATVHPLTGNNLTNLIILITKKLIFFSWQALISFAYVFQRLYSIVIADFFIFFIQYCALLSSFFSYIL